MPLFRRNTRNDKVETEELQNIIESKRGELDEIQRGIEAKRGELEGLQNIIELEREELEEIRLDVRRKKKDYEILCKKWTHRKKAYEELSGKLTHDRKVYEELTRNMERVKIHEQKLVPSVQQQREDLKEVLSEKTQAISDIDRMYSMYISQFTASCIQELPSDQLAQITRYLSDRQLLSMSRTSYSMRGRIREIALERVFTRQPSRSLLQIFPDSSVSPYTIIGYDEIHDGSCRIDFAQKIDFSDIEASWTLIFTEFDKILLKRDRSTRNIRSKLVEEFIRQFSIEYPEPVVSSLCRIARVMDSRYYDPNIKLDGKIYKIKLPNNPFHVMLLWERYCKDWVEDMILDPFYGVEIKYDVETRTISSTVDGSRMYYTKF